MASGSVGQKESQNRAPEPPPLAGPMLGSGHDSLQLDPAAGPLTDVFRLIPVSLGPPLLLPTNGTGTVLSAAANAPGFFPGWLSGSREQQRVPN